MHQSRMFIGSVTVLWTRLLDGLFVGLLVPVSVVLSGRKIHFHAPIRFHTNRVSYTGQQELGPGKKECRQKYIFNIPQRKLFDAGVYL